ncbi:MAG: cation:proton antiporter, partial [Gammaproteobacteria bacterium]|nr:cation:proton antiporter [Gammaproteobacteria bacterium]
MIAVLLLIAFLAGLVFRRLGYPPLLGFLLAGFAAHEAGVGDIETIRPLADLGITLLLFTIGLKLNLRELAQVQVWGTATAHMLIAVVLTVPVILLVGFLIPALRMESHAAAWALAFALSFSSTVFAVKIIEERGEGAALHAEIAIGILIIQDLFAVCFLVLTADRMPSPWALGLLALPFLRPVLTSLLNRAGHGELLVLFGVATAIGAYELFELVHLKGGLGALLIGILLGPAEKSSELYKSLLSLKDLFLIGFFLQIGFFGLPSPEMLLVALALSLLIFLRPLIYYFLLVGFGLRARTAFVAGFSLFNYSEFGLIVGAIAVGTGMLSPEWLTTLALAMALSL